MPRKPTKKNRLMDVLAASDKLTEKLDVWREAVRSDSLTQEERSMFALVKPAFVDEQNGRKKKKEHELDANVFEPMASNEEAHSVGAP